MKQFTFPGTHTNGESGSRFCQTCPGGHQCIDPALPPEICPDGNYSETGDV